MSLIKDTVNAMKEVILLADKVDRTGKQLSEVSVELREHDKRLVRLETFVEVAQFRGSNRNKLDDKT